MATLDKFISGVDYGTQLASNIAQTFVSYDKDIIDINKLLLYKSLGFLTQFAGSLPLSAISTAGGIISDIKNKDWNKTLQQGNQMSFLLLNTIKNLLGGITKDYIKYKSKFGEINPFLTEPQQSHWFFLTFNRMPYGWTDESREIFYVIREYIKEAELLPPDLLEDANINAYKAFLVKIFPAVFTMKVRGVYVPSITFDTVDIEATYHHKLVFPGDKIDYSNSLKINFINDFSVQEVAEIIKGSIMDNLNEIVSDRLKDELSKIIGAFIYLDTKYLGKITARDIVNMLGMSIVDNRGRHFFPYDYMVPDVTLEYIYPESDNFKSTGFLKLRNETFSNVFIESPLASEINLTYGGNTDKTDLTTSFGFQKRDFGKYKNINYIS